MNTRSLAFLALAVGLATPAMAQQTIKIGELNSYKVAARLPRPLQEGHASWRSRRSTPQAACSARSSR